MFFMEKGLLIQANMSGAAIGGEESERPGQASLWLEEKRIEVR